MEKVEFSKVCLGNFAAQSTWESCLDTFHIVCPDYHQMLSGFENLGLSYLLLSAHVVGNRRTGKFFKSSLAKAIRVIRHG